MKRHKTYKYLKRNVDWLVEPQSGSRVINEFTIPIINHNEKYLEEIAQRFKLTSVNRSVESQLERPIQRLLIGDTVFTGYRDCEDYISKVVRTLDSLAIIPGIYCAVTVVKFPSSENNAISSHLAQKVGISLYFNKEPSHSREELIELAGLEFYNADIGGLDPSKLIKDSTSENWELRTSYPMVVLEEYYLNERTLARMEMSAAAYSEAKRLEKRIELVNTPTATI